MAWMMQEWERIVDTAWFPWTDEVCPNCYSDNIGEHEIGCGECGSITHVEGQECFVCDAVFDTPAKVKYSRKMGRDCIDKPVEIEYVYDYSGCDMGKLGLSKPPEIVGMRHEIEAKQRREEYENEQKDQAEKLARFMDSHNPL